MRRSFSKVRRISFLLLMAACGSRTGLFVDEENLGGHASGSGDGGPDAGGDAITDGPPPLDVRPPVDVDRRDCPDAETLLVYTITDSYDLQSFDPDTGQFRFIGKISCPIGDNT